MYIYVGIYLIRNVLGTAHHTFYTAPSSRKPDCCCKTCRLEGRGRLGSQRTDHCNGLRCHMHLQQLDTSCLSFCSGTDLCSILLRRIERLLLVCMSSNYSTDPYTPTDINRNKS